MEFVNAEMYKKQIKKLYKSAFPANERAPMFLLFRRAKSGRGCFYAILNEGEFIGLIYTICTSELCYVFFFAITKENRGKGFGSEVLCQIKKMHADKTIILMIEDTDIANAKNIDERIKRLGFYEKNGFEKLGIKINEAGVCYDLLGTKRNVVQKDFLNIMKDFVGGFMFKILYRKTNFEE